MHQTAKAAFVFPEADGTRKLWLIVAAILAAAIAHQQLCAEQAIAANYALWLAHRRDGGKTFWANRNPGNVIEGRIAEPAIGGKKDGKNVAQEGL
jgi:hypothetical protein